VFGADTTKITIWMERVSFSMNPGDLSSLKYNWQVRLIDMNLSRNEQNARKYPKKHYFGHNFFVLRFLKF
jgi:hypothetical protein